MNYVEINEDNTVTIVKGSSENMPGTVVTSLQEEMDATYENLVKIFGEPNGQGDEYKIDVEWEIDTPHGVATIYNWKDGHNYCGPEGEDVWAITNWHIGGHNKESAIDVIEAYQKQLTV